MKKLFDAFCLVCLCALFWLATPARADGQVNVGRSPDGKVIVKLREGACAPDVLQHIPADVQKHFKGGDSVFDGAPFNVCWADIGDGTYFLVYSDTGEGSVPAAQFKLEDEGV